MKRLARTIQRQRRPRVRTTNTTQPEAHRDSWSATGPAHSGIDPQYSRFRHGACSAKTDWRFERRSTATEKHRRRCRGTARRTPPLSSRSAHRRPSGFRNGALSGRNLGDSPPRTESRPARSSCDSAESRSRKPAARSPTHSGTHVDVAEQAPFPSSAIRGSRPRRLLPSSAARRRSQLDFHASCDLSAWTH